MKIRLSRTALAWVLMVMLSSLSLAEDRKPRNDPDPHRGPTIVLSGLVTTSDTEAGGAKLADGVFGLPGVNVEIVGTRLSTQTDGRGFFYFSQGPVGAVTLVLTKAGYRTHTVAAKIDEGLSMADTVRVDMLPEGSQLVDRTPTGPGTLYVAYSPRVVEQSNSNQPWETDLFDLRKALVVSDPLEISSNQIRPHADPKSGHYNPTTGDKSTIMIYPPNSPGRTGFHQTNAAPKWLCFDQSGDTLYVANSARQIQVLDAAAANATIAVLPVWQQGFVTSLALSTDGKFVMASVMAAAPGVMMIDTVTKVPVAYLSVDGVGTMTPTAVATGPDSRRVYVVLDGQMGLGGQGLLVLVDADTGQTLSTVPVGAKPTGIAFSKDHRKAYVVNSSAGNLTVIDVGTMRPLGTLAVGVAPQKIAVTSDGTKALVTNFGSGTVSVIDTQEDRVIKSIPVGQGPWDIRVAPDGAKAYVSNREDGNISVIDLASLSTTMVTNAMPFASPLGLAIRP